MAMPLHVRAHILSQTIASSDLKTQSISCQWLRCCAQHTHLQWCKLPNFSDRRMSKLPQEFMHASRRLSVKQVVWRHADCGSQEIDQLRAIFKPSKSRSVQTPFFGYFFNNAVRSLGVSLRTCHVLKKNSKIAACPCRRSCAFCAGQWQTFRRNFVCGDWLQKGRGALSACVQMAFHLIEKVY